LLFNSLEFLIFLPIVFVLYWFVFNKTLRWQNLLILVASYFFYGWWSWKFMLLLALSTFLDYVYGFAVASPNKKRAKLFLWLSIVNNLGILGIFKYYNFFAAQFQQGLELLGFGVNPIFLNVALPIGISFYTFHGMSYVFDIYRNKQKPVSNFVDYAVFVSFFPLLVAGPIERASHLLPQVQQRRFFNYPQAVEGCRLMLWGLFKKVVIADNLATNVDYFFNNYQDNNGVSLIIGAIAFAFQIYGDFSGYSDIALGTAKLFGFELLSNFRFPYFSRDIAEFWRRWHISLSSWFRDYLYIPLGGSKKGKLKAISNTFIIFLVSGFWHGASWNFILWGGIHAFGFLPLLLLNSNRKYVTDVVAQNRRLPSIKEIWQIGVTFAFVTFAWIFFRAHGVDEALGYVKQIGNSIYHQPSQFFLLPKGIGSFIYIVPLVIGDWWFRRDERVLFKSIKSRVVRVLLYYLLIFIILRFGAFNQSSFIYFQF
jgi:alginate O-acetyltransferase complex protein AlgI